MMWSLKYFTLCLVFFITGINAGSDIGVIGLGRTVFQPLCCYACLSSFWGLQLSCTPPQRAKHDTGSSPACHSTNDPYLSSLAYCMQVKCAADNVSESQVEQCWEKVAGDGLQVSSLEDNLPASAPTTELAYYAVSLSTTSLVNDQYYEDSRRTIQSNVSAESAHALYGFGIPHTALR